ncbi:MAG: hypothetical protein JNM91_01205 [Flavobacteriales bacterium]|nr:hypothetical protein [Flavobacteriales bacterium]
MKQSGTLLAFLGLLAGVLTASAQNTLTTYYVIPPINGCDGTWAFGPYSSLWSSCTGPYMWLFEPVGCVDSGAGQPVPLNVVGDTIIMDLCSQPCDFLFYSDTGLCAVCYCGPFIPLNLAVPAVDGSFSIGPNPVPTSTPRLILDLGNTGLHYAQVLDLSGRSVLVRSVGPGRSELDLQGIPVGGYLLLLRDEAGRLTSQRFQIE